MEKPLILQIKDIEEDMMKKINESGLPAFILRPILEKIYNQLIQIEKNEVATAIRQFNESLIEKESVSVEQKK